MMCLYLLHQSIQLVYLLRRLMSDDAEASSIRQLVTDCISEGGNAIASVRLSIRPFVSTLGPTDRRP